MTGRVTVCRDALAPVLGARSVPYHDVGDASVVILTPDGEGPPAFAPLLADHARRVVVLGVPEEQAVAFLAAGAYSVLQPHASLEDVREAVDCTVRGEPKFSDRVTRLMFEAIRARADHGDGLACLLTPRELQVAELIVEGRSNKQIAGELSITLSTAKKHVWRIGQKLRLGRRREIAAELRRSGVLGPRAKTF